MSFCVQHSQSFENAEHCNSYLSSLMDDCNKISSEISDRNRKIFKFYNSIRKQNQRNETELNISPILMIINYRDEIVHLEKQYDLIIQNIIDIIFQDKDDTSPLISQENYQRFYQLSY